MNLAIGFCRKARLVGTAHEMAGLEKLRRTLWAAFHVLESSTGPCCPCTGLSVWCNDDDLLCE